MRQLTEAERVWNRACEIDEFTVLPGDEALEAMLTFHGVVMNGGVLHALQSFGPEGCEDVQSGYRYFGFEAVAGLLAEASAVSKVSDDLDLWGAELDRRYAALVPDDATLFVRFETIFHHSRSEFAPI